MHRFVRVSSNNLMKSSFFSLIFSFFSIVFVFGQETCTLLNSGTLSSRSNSDWSCTGGPNNPSEITDDGLGNVIIPNTKSLDIDVNPQTIWSSSVTIQNGGTLTLSKRLELNGVNPCTYTLTVDTGGSLIVPSGPPGQTRLYICGNFVIGVNGNPAYTASPPETISGPQVIDQNGGTLPIDLIFFNGISNKNTIQLTWATASEDNFDYFILERSYDVYDFYPLLDIKGEGGFDQFQEYTFVDEAPLTGINYYRLKAVDYDGSYEYHPIIGVNFEGDVLERILVYPNPAETKSITIRTNFEFEKAHVRILDPQGKLIMQSMQVHPSQTFQIPESMGTGLYFVELNLGFKKYMSKLIRE